VSRKKPVEGDRAERIIVEPVIGEAADPAKIHPPPAVCPAPGSVIMYGSMSLFEAVMRQLVLLAAIGVTLAGPLPAQEQTETPGPKVLFNTDDPIAFTMVADFKQVFKDRDTTKVEWFPATLRWSAADTAASLPVEVATRGHFRLRSANCGFPPLRVRFPKEGRKGTPWQGQGSLKLVTHCRGGNFDQHLLQEYLAYEAYNILSDMTLLARLGRATYVETSDTAKQLTQWAFWVEDNDDMAKRLGGVVFEEGQPSFNDVDHPRLVLVSTFLYMIGNTDWSLPFRHNMMVVLKDNVYYPVAYDFDWSGIVDAPYAKPDYRLGTRSVRERVWRGPCPDTQILQQTVTLFTEKKEAIYARYRGQEGVDPKELKNALSYLDEFYKTIADGRAVDREMKVRCN
jgi:hypothetical protein